MRQPATRPVTDMRTTTLIVVTLASFLTPFTGSSVNIALPSLAGELNLDAITLGWVATAYLLTTAIVLVPSGRLADIYGRKRVFLGGITIFGLASLLIGLAPTGGILIGFRVLQGLGAAMISSTGIAILTSVYPANEKGRVLGFNTAAVYVGLSVGPTVGGFITQQFGWRGVFLANIPLAALAAVLTIWRLGGEWAEARGDKFDVLGTVIYALALLTLIYGFSLLPAPSGFALIAVSIVAFAVFLVWEGRTASPILDIGMFKNNTVFTLSNIAALINYSATSASGFLLSLYLQQIKGFTPQVAGIVLISQPIVQALFSPLAGRLSDTVEPRLLASAGMSMTAVGLFMFSFLSPDTPDEVIILVLMLLGLGFGLFSSPNTNAVMSSVQRRLYGVASATLSTMRTVGQTLSIGMAVLIFAIVIGHVEITPAYYPQLMTSIRLTFTLFAVLCVFGIFASLSRGTLHH